LSSRVMPRNIIRHAINKRIKIIIFI
jgi:hypothetical protein